MSDKPSYLGLLNAVSLAETAAHEYLTAWAAVTPHEGVKATLLTVAAREGEHGMSFAKRISELGYNLRPGPDDPQGRRLGMALVLRVAKDLQRRGGPLRVAERDPLRAPLPCDNDHLLHEIGPDGGRKHVGKHRLHERGAARAIERLQQTLLGEAKALDRDDRRSPHG